MLDFWGPSKRLLGDFNFLEDLKNYKKDEIPESVMNDIRNNFMNQPLFKISAVAKASSAAEGLCRWIIAMESYDRVAKVRSRDESIASIGIPYACLVQNSGEEIVRTLTLSVREHFGINHRHNRIEK